MYDYLQKNGRKLGRDYTSNISTGHFTIVKQDTTNPGLNLLKVRVSSRTSVTCVLHLFVIILKNYIGTYLLHIFLMVKSDKSRWVPMLLITVDLLTFHKSKCFKLYIRNSLQENGKHDTLYLIYLDSLHLKRVKSEFKVEKSTLEWNPRSPIHHIRHF